MKTYKAEPFFHEIGLFKWFCLLLFRKTHGDRSARSFALPFGNLDAGNILLAACCDAAKIRNESYTGMC